MLRERENLLWGYAKMMDNQQALEGKDVKDILTNIGSGAGAAPAAGAAGGAAGGGGDAAPEAKKEEKKEEGTLFCGFVWVIHVTWLLIRWNYRKRRIRRRHGLWSVRLVTETFYFSLLMG